MLPISNRWRMLRMSNLTNSKFKCCRVKNSQDSASSFHRMPCKSIIRFRANWIRWRLILKRSRKSQKRRCTSTIRRESTSSTCQRSTCSLSTRLVSYQGITTTLSMASSSYTTRVVAPIKKALRLMMIQTSRLRTKMRYLTSETWSKPWNMSKKWSINLVRWWMSLSLYRKIKRRHHRVFKPSVICCPSITNKWLKKQESVPREELVLTIANALWDCLRH